MTREQDYTVAIPVFNAATTLSKVLAAARRFEPKPKEIIVVDDCSTDGSGEIAREFHARVLTHQERRGLAGARNTALSEVRTELVLWLDSDFVPDQQVPRAFLAGLGSEDVAGVGGRAEEAVIVGRADLWRKVHASQDHGLAPKHSSWMIMGLCALHRVEVLRGVGGFDERFRGCGEDVEMSLRLRRCGYRLVYQPAARGDHLRHDDDASLITRMAEYIRCTSAALMLHGKRPRRHFLPILLKQAVLHPLSDMVAGRFELLPLDWQINRARWMALRELGQLQGSRRNNFTF